MIFVRTLIPLAVLVMCGSATRAAAQPSAPAGPLSADDPAPLPRVVVNDNRQPAGTLANGVLTLRLRAAAGEWRPEKDAGPALRVEAFGEGSAALTIPSPLIRVPEGTEIAASVRNELTSPLRVYGLCERPGSTCPPVDVAPGQARDVRFKAGQPGTYHYWATTTGSPLMFRAVNDTQLSGALIIDSTDPADPAGAAPNADRVFVITDWTSLSLDQLKQLAQADDPGAAFLALDPKFTFPINGLSWPHTERLAYRLHEPVRWRVINLSTQVHTMHLHGFHYEIDSLGDGMKDTSFGPGQKQRVVTQLLNAGATMSMTWVPERAGNWLFHCHVMAHVAPTLRLGGDAASNGGHQAHHSADQASAGMAGMILGITIVDPEGRGTSAESHEPSNARRLTLAMQAEPNRYGDAPGFGFVLERDKDEAKPASSVVPVPGPTLVLKRGEPVEITLVNRLPEATAIHWHGMELESYYDGVHGWSGAGTRVTPMIEPGQSFVVRFTPPLAGTFMYHTHLHDFRQLTSGLYGAMLVMDPEASYDETLDHVFVMGRAGPKPSKAVLNGEREPRLVVWKAGARHRIRLINITPSDIFTVTLQTADGPVMWRPVAKDGAALPPDRCQPVPARQAIGVGETYDFELEAPRGRQTLWLEVRSPGGRWLNQQQVVVK